MRWGVTTFVTTSMPKDLTLHSVYKSACLLVWIAFYVGKLKNLLCNSVMLLVVYVITHRVVFWLGGVCGQLEVVTNKIIPVQRAVCGAGVMAHTVCLDLNEICAGWQGG